MLIGNIESIGGQKRREVLAGKAHDEGVTSLISNNLVKVLLDDKLGGITDLLVRKLIQVKQNCTYVDRLEVEHARIMRVQDLVLNHLIEVFHKIDALEHISLGVE